MKFYQKHKQLSMWIAAFIFVSAVLIFKEIISNLSSVFSVFGAFIEIISPFIAGFIIAFILYVPCNKIENLFNKAKKPNFFSKHSRGVSVLIVYVAVVAIIVAVMALLIPWLVNSLVSLYNNRDAYYQSILNFVESKCDASGKLYGLFDPTGVLTAVNPNNLLDNINVDELVAVADGVYRAGVAVIDAILAVVSSVYMLLSREALMGAIGRFFQIFFERKRVSQTNGYLAKIASIFYSYMYSTLLDALVVAVLSSVALLIIGIDYAPLFGVLVGISNLVPYFGAIIAGIAVSVFAVVTDGWITAVIVAASILVIQQVDCNLIQPKIIGKTVGLRPIYTLIAITVGGGVFGIAGVLLGVPVFATLLMVFNDLAEYHQSKLEKEAMMEAVDEAVVKSDEQEEVIENDVENTEN